MSNNIPFTMQGAREISAFGLPHLQRQIEGLENAIRKDEPEYVFDFAKALLESVCKTILSERGIDVGSNWNTQRLLKETLENLKLVPNSTSHAGEASDSIRKINGSLQTVVQGIAELRNKFGLASHGKEPGFQGLGTAHALLVARSVDAIVHFLFTIHRLALTEPEPPLEYTRYPSFNDYVDEQNEPVQIEVFEDALEYTPSEVLYYVDLSAYEYYLQLFLDREMEAGDE